MSRFNRVSRFRQGCQVQDLPATEGFPEGAVGFTIVALGGQLRWRSETGPVVGDLSVPKGLQHFRSENHPYEHAFTICCDVPHHVLNRLEAERGGAPPIFWMDLAGSWAINGNIQPIYQRPWRFEVPNDMWLAFLSESGYEDFDVVELRRVLQHGGSVQRAVDYLNAARQTRRERSAQGSRDLPSCWSRPWTRISEIKGTDAIKDHSGSLHRRSAVASSTAASFPPSVKQLASMHHHDFGRNSVFTRPEALALVRHCEALLLMVGELTQPPRTGSDDGS